jgi:CO/xanthine dehydrogenase Mo-binding subunit
MKKNNHFTFSRRTFFGIVGAAGVQVVFNQLAEAHTARPPLLAGLPAPLRETESPSSQWSGPPGKARYRIEGIQKVTGQKIYARDFRARDMAGWPQQERLAWVVRATQVDCLFTGINLSMLPSTLQPLRVVTQADLVRDKIKLPYGMQSPEVWPSGLMAAAGTRPIFFGQPLAMLIFTDFDTFRRAKQILQFNPNVVQYGAKAPVPPANVAYSPSVFLTRYEAPGVPDFSQVQDGESNPYAQPPTPVDKVAIAKRQQIANTFAQPSLRTFSGTYSTQVLDPMFMEPEAGLAWLDRSKPQSGNLNLVLGTQATNGDMADTLGLFSNSGCPINVGTVVLNSCYPGGGFGGRDVSTFPPLLALAAAYTDAPVRIAQDRYEQFQSGLKQLDSRIEQRIAVDGRGYFVAFQSSQRLNGGGNNNYSQFIAMLAGYCGLSGYNITKASVDAKAMPTPGVIGGSMRGFGGPQASFAVETLVDELAVSLGADPIQLRQINVLQTGQRTVTGAPLTQPMTLVKICELAKQHSLWTQRKAMQKKHSAGGLLYGVGFALANQAYGTGTDGVMAEVSISIDGALTVRTNCVDMGNGSATTLAISTAGFAGNNAAQVVMGDAGYFAAPLALQSGSGGSWNDPTWTASFAMSSSACLTAFHQVHVTEQAARALFETGMLPAAALLWRVPVEKIRDKTSWRDGKLFALQLPQLPALDIRAIAKQIYAAGFSASAMTHGLYQGRWVRADYTVGNWTARKWPIDGLSTLSAGSKVWQPRPRFNIMPPEPQAALYGRSLFSPSGALTAVLITPSSGHVQVVAVELFVDAGKVIQPDLLAGQAQGGVAMGIGYALLENLPLLAEGAGDGRWNLDRYQVALASDVPLGKLGLNILPTTETTGKGIAEAVLCPIAPAIGNAVAAATGKRFRSLPITPANIREALK